MDRSATSQSSAIRNDEPSAGSRVTSRRSGGGGSVLSPPPPPPAPQPARASAAAAASATRARASCGGGRHRRMLRDAAGPAAPTSRRSRMPSRTARRTLIAAVAVAAGAAIAATAPAASAPADATVKKVVRGAGDIRPAVQRFRALLGPDNGGGPGGRAGGRREINWDGVPDELASPNRYPSDFFNARDGAARARRRAHHPGRRPCASAPTPTTPPARRRGSATSTRPTPASSRPSARSGCSRRSAATSSNLTFRVPGTGAAGASCAASAPSTRASTGARTRRSSTSTAPGARSARFAVPVGARRALVPRAWSSPPRSSRGCASSTAAARSGPDDGGAVDAAVMDDFIYGEPVAPR